MKTIRKEHSESELYKEGALNIKRFYKVIIKRFYNGRCSEMNKMRFRSHQNLIDDDKTIAFQNTFCGGGGFYCKSVEIRLILLPKFKNTPTFYGLKNVKTL